MSTAWIIAARHQAFGTEGERVYIGTELGARRAAAKLARAAGHGWTPVVHERGETVDDFAAALRSAS